MADVALLILRAVNHPLLGSFFKAGTGVLITSLWLYQGAPIPFHGRLIGATPETPGGPMAELSNTFKASEFFDPLIEVYNNTSSPSPNFPIAYVFGPLTSTSSPTSSPTSSNVSVKHVPTWSASNHNSITSTTLFLGNFSTSGWISQSHVGTITKLGLVGWVFLALIALLLISFGNMAFPNCMGRMKARTHQLITYLNQPVIYLPKNMPVFITKLDNEDNSMALIRWSPPYGHVRFLLDIDISIVRNLFLEDTHQITCRDVGLSIPLRSLEEFAFRAYLAWYRQVMFHEFFLCLRRQRASLEQQKKSIEQQQCAVLNKVKEDSQQERNMNAVTLRRACTAEQTVKELRQYKASLELQVGNLTREKTKAEEVAHSSEVKVAELQLQLDDLKLQKEASSQKVIDIQESAKAAEKQIRQMQREKTTFRQKVLREVQLLEDRTQAAIVQHRDKAMSDVLALEEAQILVEAFHKREYFTAGQVRLMAANHREEIKKRQNAHALQMKEQEAAFTKLFNDAINNQYIELGLQNDKALRVQGDALRERLKAEHQQEMMNLTRGFLALESISDQNGEAPQRDSQSSGISPEVEITDMSLPDQVQAFVDSESIDFCEEQSPSTTGRESPVQIAKEFFSEQIPSSTDGVNEGFVHTTEESLGEQHTSPKNWSSVPYSVAKVEAAQKWDKTSTPKRQKRRQRFCSFFQRGTCKFGSDCRFLHEHDPAFVPQEN